MIHRVAVVGQNRKWVTAAAGRFAIELGFKRIRLYDPMNIALRHLYGVKEYKNVKFEAKQQFYDAWHKIDPEIWVSKARRRIENTSHSVIVPDVRYMNEIQVLEDLGFIFVRVTSKPSTSLYITGLAMNTNPGAILYYEHFSPATIKCKYSVEINSYPDARKSIGRIIKYFD